MGQLLLARPAEGRDSDPERPGVVEHVADGAILARRIRALQDHQQRPLSLREELVLPLIDDFGIGLALRLRPLAVRKGARILRIALGKIDALARGNAKPLRQAFWHRLAPMWLTCAIIGGLRAGVKHPAHPQRPNALLSPLLAERRPLPWAVAVLVPRVC